MLCIRIPYLHNTLCNEENATFSSLDASKAVIFHRRSGQPALAGASDAESQPPNQPFVV